MPSNRGFGIQGPKRLTILITDCACFPVFGIQFDHRFRLGHPGLRGLKTKAIGRVPADARWSVRVSSDVGSETLGAEHATFGGTLLTLDDTERRG